MSPRRDAVKSRALDISKNIFALSSGSVPAAIAVVRLSGPDAFSIAGQLLKKKPANFGTRAMHLVRLYSPDGGFIDEALVLTFPGPHSFTGQDVVEFQCHGSVPVVEALEQALHSLGASPAEKGEFSYRAFINGKLDAQRVEALADVYAAKDGSDLKSIYLRLDVATRVKVEKLRDLAVQVQAIFDTSIDFADEYSEVVQAARAPLSLLLSECSWMLSRYSGFRLERAVPRLVLAGRPNAGKSSLFNALLCRYRAIVHSEAGTTRDVIEEDFLLGDRRWKLVDTAGVRDGVGVTEAQGIEIAEQYLKNAALWILVVDGQEGVRAEDRVLLDRFRTVPHLVVWNKMDKTTCPPASPEAFCEVSALTGEGLPTLMERLQNLAPQSEAGIAGFLPSASQAKRLQQALGSLEKILSLLDVSAPPEYLAEESRQVLSCLEDLVGYVDTEVILDRIFSDFCIGK
jgi:tRNA modification GTPase